MTTSRTDGLELDLSDQEALNAMGIRVEDHHWYLPLQDPERKEYNNDIVFTGYELRDALKAAKTKVLKELAADYRRRAIDETGPGHFRRAIQFREIESYVEEMRE